MAGSGTTPFSRRPRLQGVAIALAAVVVAYSFVLAVREVRGRQFLRRNANRLSSSQPATAGATEHLGTSAARFLKAGLASSDPQIRAAAIATYEGYGATPSERASDYAETMTDALFDVDHAVVEMALFRFFPDWPGEGFPWSSPTSMARRILQRLDSLPLDKGDEPVVVEFGAVRKSSFKSGPGKALLLLGRSEGFAGLMYVLRSEEHSLRLRRWAVECLAYLHSSGDTRRTLLAQLAELERSPNDDSRLLGGVGKALVEGMEAGMLPKTR